MKCSEVSRLFLILLVTSSCGNPSSIDSPSRLIRLLQRNGIRNSLIHDMRPVHGFSDVSVRPGTVVLSSEKPVLNYDPHHHRPSKRTGEGDKVQSVCKSEYAVDSHGNRVKVLQRISMNGTIVNQYFFQTICSSHIVYESDDIFGTSFTRKQNGGEEAQANKCLGIDEKKYDSICKEDMIWTNAQVESVDGEVGWSWILVPGSCGCAIWPTPQEATSSIGRRTHSVGSGSGRRSYMVSRDDPFL